MARDIFQQFYLRGSGWFSNVGKITDGVLNQGGWRVIVTRFAFSDIVLREYFNRVWTGMIPIPEYGVKCGFRTHMGCSNQAVHCSQLHGRPHVAIQRPLIVSTI
jgi:hypothetical protein